MKLSRQREVVNVGASQASNAARLVCVPQCAVAVRSELGVEVTFNGSQGWGRGPDERSDREDLCGQVSS